MAHFCRHFGWLFGRKDQRTLAAFGKTGVMVLIGRHRITWNPLNDENPSQDGWLHRVDFAEWRLL